MPQCGCFHQYELTQVAPGQNHLLVYDEGHIDVLNLLRRSGLVTEADDCSDVLSILSGRRDLRLEGVQDEAKLRNFFELLKSRIVIDLRPSLDECYALGPYTVFDEGQPTLAAYGELLNRAKYSRDESASQVLCSELKAFVNKHPTLGKCQAIIAAPKSDATTPDLAGQWAQNIATNKGWSCVQAEKVRSTAPQKNLSEEDTEEAAVARVANSVVVKNIRPVTSVLIIDDTIRSAGTMMEIARALRAAGTGQVFGLSVAKDAKFTLGGIDLNKEVWP